MLLSETNHGLIYDTDSAAKASNPYWNIVAFITGRMQVSYSEFFSFFRKPSLN